MNFNNNNNTSLSKKNLLYSSFNQINDCIIFGTNTGFYVYTLDPFKKIIARKITGGVSIVKMLFKSNIILFVGNVEKGVYPNNKLIVWDDHKREVIGEISFKSKILNIELTKEIIIVVCSNKIYIYNFQNLVLVKSIETGENLKGLCSISNEEHNLNFPLMFSFGMKNFEKLSNDLAFHVEVDKGTTIAIEGENDTYNKSSDNYWGRLENRKADAYGGDD